jgi:hypothetical protein
LRAFSNPVLRSFVQTRIIPRGGNNSHIIRPEQNINEVIHSIGSMHEKIEEFYAIHGTALQVTPDSCPNFRRLK